MATVTFNCTVRDDESGKLMDGLTVQVERLSNNTFESVVTNIDGFAQVVFDELDIITTEDYTIRVLASECTAALTFGTLSQAPDSSASVLIAVFLQPVENCFDPLSVNNFNFYRWHRIRDAVLPLQRPLTNCFCFIDPCYQDFGIQPTLFPTQYKKGLARFGDKPTAIQVFVGYTMALQVNFNPENKQTSTDFVLKLMDSTDVILENFAILEFITDDDGNVNIFTTFEFPIAPPGIFFLALFTASDELIYVCSPVEVLPIERLNESGEIRYRNQNPIYDYQYNGSEEIEAFENVARIPLSVLGIEYRDDEEVYKEVSTGVHLAYKSETDRVFNVEIYFVDDNVHEAAATAIKHDAFKINGIELQKAGPYAQEKNRSYNKSRANIQFFDNKFARVNKGC